MHYSTSLVNFVLNQLDCIKHTISAPIHNIHDLVLDITACINQVSFPDVCEKSILNLGLFL